MQTDQLLTPNQQLAVIFGLFIALTLAIALAFALIRRQLIAIEGTFGSVVPLWQHLRSELFAILRHPHSWAVELDDLMDEAELEPEVHMAPERYERMLALLSERVLSTSPELRVNEARAAGIVLLALPFVRDEARSLTELTGVVLVGSQAPAGQSSEDANARENAN